MEEKEDDLDIRIRQLGQSVTKVVTDIKNFDSDGSSPTDLFKLYKRLDRLKGELEDLSDEVEVEDFLENGPGIKNKNI